MRQVLIILIYLLMLTPASADQVTVEYDGFELVGDLVVAEGKSLKKDGGVLLLHDLLSDITSAPVSGLQQQLASLGVNSLAINLSLGLDRRDYPYACTFEQDHRYQDALPEIHAWVQWLQKQGVGNLTLAGFGFGANQIALYATKTTQPSVRRVVLISPTTWSHENTVARYEQRFKTSLVSLLADVELKIASDSGGTLLEGVGFLDCDNAVVTARSFASYYRDTADLDTPGLIPKIKKPTLVVAAELDSVSPDLVSKMQQVEARPDLVFDVIEAADRTFAEPFTEQLANRIGTFIDEH